MVATAEEILRDEYRDAQEQFDHAKENPGTRADIQGCSSRYLKATIRLRKYLAKGEIPPDIASRLAR